MTEIEYPWDPFMEVEALAFVNARRARQLESLQPDLFVEVSYPCSCLSDVPIKTYLYSVVMHLNDSHTDGDVETGDVPDKWTREQIADWIDEVTDGLR